MGEEKKEETAAAEKKEEVKEEKEEKKKKEEEKEEVKEIVVKVDMHCEACARKVARALKGFQGVDEVRADCKASKVVVKGKVTVDPMEVCRRIQKKTSRKVELVSPLPPPKTKEEQEEEDKKKKEEEEEKKKKKEAETKQDKKPEPPPVITVVLKAWMHCEACAHRLQKKIRKIEGVESVTTDIANDRVLVKGVLDPEKLVNDVYKKTGKHALVVKEEEKKEEVKKDEEKKDEEKQDENKDPEENKEDDDKKTDIKKMEHWPSKYYMEQYSYAPQIFSDENPNACTVM